MRSVGSTIFILGIAILLREPGSAYSQDAFDNPAGTPPARLAALPTENTLRDALPMPSVPADLAQDTGFRDRERADFWQRMRPTFNLETEWLPASDEVGIFSYGAKMSIPTYPIFGPPPPLIQLGFSRTEFGQTGDQQLPADVSDFSFGLSWVRRLNERWTLRLMTTAAFASDGENTSGDAWQFRGGVFAIYSRDPEWIWTVGALALAVALARGVVA